MFKLASTLWATGLLPSTSGVIGRPMLYNANTGKKERLGRLFVCTPTSVSQVRRRRAYRGPHGYEACLHRRHVYDESARGARILDIPDRSSKSPSNPGRRPTVTLSAAPNKLAKEDPSFRVKGNEETGQTLIAGMGELHLASSLISST